MCTLTGHALLKEHFADGTYADVPGLCKVATRAEIAAQGWSLNPGRYTGTAVTEEDDEDFDEKLAGLFDEFTRLRMSGISAAGFSLVPGCRLPSWTKFPRRGWNSHLVSC